MQLRDLEEHLAQLKALAGNKTEEIYNHKRELAMVASNSNDLLKAKRQLEEDCSIESNKKQSIQAEARHIADLNDKLARDEAESNIRVQENVRLIKDFNERIDILTKKVMDTNLAIKSNESELSATLERQESLQRQLDDVVLSNSKLQSENRDLSLRANDLDVQVNRLNVRYKDTLMASEEKDKELKMAKSTLGVSERRMIETLEQARELRKENDILQSLLGKHRSDAEAQKRLREQEAIRKLEIAQEKKRLEQEVLTRDLEARSAKKELEIVQVNKERLLNNHLQLSGELDALKEHAELLESQNHNVSFCAIV
eukprot:TRINITY_DN2192_c0_g1_i4.p1 TRINITY_DN2192_c0_g1~~TRINITY_DN2192_c0_g1_i4.p1  ORF type:complete len:314 (+),score=114.38 TRINITY_DN2192_c0_g1_i4:435-1376(+)